MTRTPKASRGLVLVVEHTPLERQALVWELQRAGFYVREASGYEEALVAMGRSPDLIAVVSDCNLKGRAGLELVAEVRRRAPSMVRILYSGSPLERQVQVAVRGRVVDAFLSKPWPAGELAATIRGLRRLNDG